MTGSVIGIDMGIKDSLFHRTALLMKTISTSQRAKRNLPNCNGSSLEKQKGSRNRDKARLQIARLHEHISNQRKDMLHKLSSQLIRENDVICIEDLAPKNMVKTISSPSPYRTRAGASSADSLNIKSKVVRQRRSL